MLASPWGMNDWVEALRSKAGPLVDAAKAFLRWRHLEVGPGAHGITALAVALDDYCEDENPHHDDDRFIEGAGATLGLLLIEHLDGEHRLQDGKHRVRLGGRGFFDPFGAIDRALDADDPRQQLALSIGDAEREAKGDGTVSNTVCAFIRELERHRTDLHVVEQFELELRLSDGTEVDLQRLAHATRDESAKALQRAASKFVSMLPGRTQVADCSWSDAATRLLPRLVSSKFLQGLPESSGVFASRFMGDVHVALLVDYADRARFVRSAEVDRWKKSGALPLRVALENLASRSDKARFTRIETADGPLLVARSGDGLDAARLLLPSLYAVLREELSGTIVVSVPHRDTLIACEAASAVRKHLQSRVTDDMRRAPHAISSTLFEITPRGPRVWMIDDGLTVAAPDCTES